MKQISIRTALLSTFAASTNPVGNGGLTPNALGVPYSCFIEAVWIQ